MSKQRLGLHGSSKKRHKKDAKAVKAFVDSEIDLVFGVSLGYGF